MLTVKQISLDGYETIYECRKVCFTPSGYVDDDGNKQPEVFVELPSGEEVALAGGTVYVMNEGGKTVADYHLRAVSKG